MAKLKTKLLLVAVLGVVLAIFYPKIKAVYSKHVKPHADIAANIVRVIKDFHIFGYHVPWKYVLPGFGLFLAVQLFRVSFKLILLFVKSFPRVFYLFVSAFKRTRISDISLLLISENSLNFIGMKIALLFSLTLRSSKSIKATVFLFSRSYFCTHWKKDTTPNIKRKSNSFTQTPVKLLLKIV